jgi:hypothetical protein
VETPDEPYYSEIESVYHTLPECPIGRRTPPELRRSGTGGRIILCPACEVRVQARRRRDPDGD